MGNLVILLLHLRYLRQLRALLQRVLPGEGTHS